MLSLSVCVFPSLILNSKDENTTIILPVVLHVPRETCSSTKRKERVGEQGVGENIYFQEGVREACKICEYFKSSGI